jgi:hypothetical protein
MTTEPVIPTDARPSNEEADFAALRARLHRARPGGAHT